MKIKPINGNIVIEVDNEAEKTASGLLVPNVKGERTEAYMIRGIVREIAEDLVNENFRDYIEVINLHARSLEKNPHRENSVKMYEELLNDTVDPKVKVGDKVYVSKWEAQHGVLDGKDIIIVKQKDILGILS